MVAPRPSSAGSVLLLSWAHFLNDGAANYLPGVLPAILAALTIPVGYAGAVMAILVVGQGLQPLLGALADRWGRRRFVMLGLAGTSIGAAWVGLARSPWGLLAALCLIGATNACFHPPAMATARQALPGRGEHAMAIFSVGGEFGRGVWPLIASIVVTLWGLHALWILALPGLATVVWLDLRMWPPHAAGAAAPAWQGMRAAGRPLAVLVGYSGLRSVLMTGVAAFVPLWWQERGGSLVVGAALVTVMLVVGIIGNLGAASLSHRFGSRRLVAIGTAAACVLLAAFLYSGGVWVWVTMAGFGIALFATLPLTIVMGQDLLPQNHALASGFALGFPNALGAIVVALLGLLAARWGAAGVLWTIEACGLLSLGLAWRLPSASSAR